MTMFLSFRVILTASSHLYPRPTYQSIFLAHLAPSTLCFSFDTFPLDVLLPLPYLLSPSFASMEESTTGVFPSPLCPSSQDRARDTEALKERTD